MHYLLLLNLLKVLRMFKDKAGFFIKHIFAFAFFYVSH